MKTLGALVGFNLAISAYASKKPVRGVGPEFAKFYEDGKSFACISSPSIILPAGRVNDDYCDCPDGSDEPGTSACAHLSSSSPHTPANSPPNTVNASHALPGFYCQNAGHTAAYVPFTSVNDGHCDYDLCCDGSEEWAGLTKCENKCKEIGKEFRKLHEARQKSLDNAARKRQELVTEAARLRLQVEDRLKTLNIQIQANEVKLSQLEQELAEVERREKGKIVRAGKVGGKLGVLVGLAHQRTEELRSRLLQIREQRDSSRGRLQELESILSTFKDEYNPNFNDEGVKRAVRAWEDYAARDKGAEPDDSDDQDLDTIVQEDKENGLNWDEFNEINESDTDVLYEFENYLPPTIRTWLDQKLRDLRVTLVDAGILAAPRNPDGESKVVVDARDRVKATRREIEDQRRSLDEHNGDLTKDFGPDGVFRALKDKCVTVESGEYTYEVCYYGSTTQIPQKGGGRTNMGKFTGLDRVVVDDELPPDGRGLGKGERIAMRFENGQHCWNGPLRSTLVVMACAESDEIYRVVEEEKCVYRMELGTPAACVSDEAGNSDAGNGVRRDEL